MEDLRRHEDMQHANAERHHGHSHAAGSVHPHGAHVLQVEGLSVGFEMYESDAPFFKAKRRTVQAIDGLSVSVHQGEIVAVVGASGSGKTLLADAVMGLFEPNATVRGRVWFEGRRLEASDLPGLRGNGISLVPQSVAHLDPLMKVGRQVRGRARSKEDRDRRARRQRELFAHYGLAPEVEGLYPHELSGGMARRVLLCCALMDEPRLIVADEPTPGLDLELAVRAMDDFRAFADEGGSVLLITHDIDLALRVADRVAVFKDGAVVEETSVASFASPDTLEHPFAKALWHALPEHDFATAVSSGDSEASAPREAGRPDDSPRTVARTSAGEGACTGEGADRACLLEAIDVSFAYDGRRPLFDGFSLAVAPGERVALQAPSGFGKTTLCRLLAGFEHPTSGRILCGGRPLPEKGVRPVQLIGQHPELMVDPRMRLGSTLEEAGPIDAELCRDLGIRQAWLSRYPHELSGGELQRFCIARALMAGPRFLIADEVSTMLDALTQAQIWDFLLNVAEEREIGLVFVSHTPALSERIATRTVDLAKLAR